VSPGPRFVRYALPALLYAGAIFFVSSLSHPPGPPLVHGLDKVVHCAVYAVLGLLTVQALAGYGLRPLQAALWALLVCALYGVSDEWHQAFVPGRSTDIRDWAADVLGAALAVRVWWARQKAPESAVEPEGVR
jgi:VanZ family protein